MDEEEKRLLRAIAAERLLCRTAERAERYLARPFAGKARASQVARILKDK